MVCAHLSGSIDWAARLDDRRYERPCKPATFCLQRAEEAGEVRLSNAHSRFVHFYLPVDWFADRLAELAPQKRPAAVELIDPMNARCPDVDRCARMAARALSEDGWAARLEIEAAGLLLAATLIRRHSNATGRVSFKGGLAPWQVKRVSDLLAERLADAVGLEAVAAEVGLSPFHFARAFKRATGSPPHRYQMMLRIERAKTLLEKTQLPIADVAAAIGYEDQGYLARLFQKHLGVSPAQYRRGQ